MRDALGAAVKLKTNGKFEEAAAKLRSLTRKGKRNVRAAARHELAVLALQRGDATVADEELCALGLRYRISAPLWLGARQGRALLSSDSMAGSVRVLDNALPEGVFQQLRQALLAPKFWEEHGYPTDEFFSYSLPLGRRHPRKLLGAVAARFRRTAEVLAGEECGRVEWWTHRRSAGADGGHQLHFDLDELGMRREGTLRCPAVSLVFYVEADGVAPTVVTNEDVAGGDVATCSVRCHPKANRALFFKGSLMHGVVPMLPESEERERITLMMGFWAKSTPPLLSDAPSRAASGVLISLGPNMVMPRLRRSVKRKGKPSPHGTAKRLRSGTNVGAGWSELLMARVVKCDDTGNGPCASTEGAADLEVVSPVWEQVSGWSQEMARARLPGLFTGEFFVGHRAEVRAAAQRAAVPSIGVESVSIDELRRLRGEPEQDVVETVSIEELRRLRGE